MKVVAHFEWFCDHYKLVFYLHSSKISDIFRDLERNVYRV